MKEGKRKEGKRREDKKKVIKWMPTIQTNFKVNHYLW